MQRIILFDIDLTLISSQVVTNLIRKKIAKTFKIKRKEVDRFLIEYRNSLPHKNDFNPKTALLRLAKHFQLAEENILEIYEDSRIYQKAKYKDVEKGLKFLKNQGWILGVYSEGFDFYQRLKLKKSGIWEYFDKKYVFIFRRKMKLEAIKKLPKGAMVVDDNMEVIETLKKSKRVIPFWLNRKEHDLKAIIDYVENKKG